MKKCTKCGAAIDTDDTFQHAGMELCEDCYLDAVAVPKTCDPWAVHSAKNTTGHVASLTALQESILRIIRDKGPVSASRVCEELGITEQEFRTQFATLRHMELARACKDGDQIQYTLF